MLLQTRYLRPIAPARELDERPRAAADIRGFEWGDPGARGNGTDVVPEMRGGGFRLPAACAPYVRPGGAAA